MTHYPRLQAQLFSFRGSQREAEELQREPEATLACTPRLRGSTLQVTHRVCALVGPPHPPPRAAGVGSCPCAALPAASARVRHVLPALARERERHRRGLRSRSASRRRCLRRCHSRSSCSAGRHGSAGSPRGVAGWGRQAQGAHLVSTARFSFFQLESHRGCRIPPEPLPQHGNEEDSGEGRESIQARGGSAGERDPGGQVVGRWRTGGARDAARSCKFRKVTLQGRVLCESDTNF